MIKNEEVLHRWVKEKHILDGIPYHFEYISNNYYCAVPDVACLLGTPIIVKVDAEGITDLEPEEYKKTLYGMLWDGKEYTDADTPGFLM